MDTSDFLKTKGKLKELARKSVLFGLLPESLGEFEKLVDDFKQGPGSEKFVNYFINLFEEEKQELAPVIDILKSALLDASK